MLVNTQLFLSFFFFFLFLRLAAVLCFPTLPRKKKHTNRVPS